MPPLMLTPDEIEVAVLGAQWVAGRGDPQLAKAAADLVAKIAATLPERLRPYVHEPAGVTPPWRRVSDGLDMARLRASIRACRKVELAYVDDRGQSTTRTVWPITVGYFDAVRVLVGWCELRQDFRHFRTDRVTGAAFLDDPYPERRAVLRARWRRGLPKPPVPAQSGPSPSPSARSGPAKPGSDQP
jgi:predicted DNA-binding transcriptional regulator YafY